MNCNNKKVVCIHKSEIKCGKIKLNGYGGYGSGGSSSKHQQCEW